MQCIPKLSFPTYRAIFPRPRMGRGPSLSLDFNLPGIWGLCPRPRAHSDPCVQRQGRPSLFLESYQFRSSYQRLWGPEVREGATGPVDFSREGQEVGNLSTPVGSPACFLFLRWHCISEEPPQRTLGNEDIPSNKLRRMKLYLFLALQGKPFVLLWPSLDMPCLFLPPSLSTGCTTLNAFAFSACPSRPNSRPVFLGRIYAFSSPLRLLFPLRVLPVMCA